MQPIPHRKAKIPLCVDPYKSLVPINVTPLLGLEELDQKSHITKQITNSDSTIKVSKGC